MNSFIDHTLTMLEDVGVSIQYPKISHITIDAQGKSTRHINHISTAGNRVDIEQNQKMKFIMLFSLLDFYVDTNYSNLEGKNYSEKYENLPTQNEFDLVLRELFRIGKVLRNGLIHNLSSFTITNECVRVDYKRGKNSNKHFLLNMSMDAFKYFHTAIVMYIKGDMGKGNYFLGVIRSIYARILAGIIHFKDEFDTPLKQPSTGIRLNPNVRRIILRPPCEINGELIQFAIAKNQIPDSEGMDVYVVIDENEFLIPREALGENMSITKRDMIAEWKREGSFPWVKA